MIDAQLILSQSEPGDYPPNGLYAKIEYHGSPKPCRVALAGCHGDNGLVIIDRGRSPKIWLSGNRHRLADELSTIANQLRGDVVRLVDSTKGDQSCNSN